ncbi:MAG: tetratricopeptide repeat protein [Saprospiraceae bacterium]
MKFLTLLCFLLGLNTIAQAQEVSLRIRVLYDGEKSRAAGNAIVYFSDGQMATTNKKGIAYFKFNLTDTNQLLRIEKIVTTNGEEKLVNRQQLQYILLDNENKKVEVKAYILEDLEWSARESKMELVVSNQNEKMEAEFASIPDSEFKLLLQEKFRVFKNYNTKFVSNISSTVYAELSGQGKKAFNLLMESSEKLPHAIELLEQLVEKKKDAFQDMLLLARLSGLSSGRISGNYYLQKNRDEPVMLGTIMEYKEMAIMFNQSPLLEAELKRLLSYIKDPEFQAVNHNDLASYYQERGDYETAVIEASKALDYFTILEKKNPKAFRVITIAVMFNLGSAYMELKRNEEALDMFHATLEKISPEMLKENPEILSIDFYAKKYIANITKKVKGLKEAYPYYKEIFIALKASPEIALTLPKDLFFEDYKSYCEGKELLGANAEEVADCYEESIKFLDNAFDVERKTLGRTLVYYKLGEILDAKGDFKKALEFYRRSLSELEQNETSKTRALSMQLYACIGELLDNHGQDKEALDYFHQSLQIALNTNYEKDVKSIRQLAESWYKIGHFFYERHNGDSAYYAFNKAIEYLTDPIADKQKNATLLASTYNTMGATLSELHNDTQRGEENFIISVNLYRELMEIDPEKHLIEFASAARNLLVALSRHIETANKEETIALIDVVSNAFIKYPVRSEKADEIQKDLKKLKLEFSGQMSLIKNAMKEIQILNDERKKVEGNTAKSEIQSRIVSKLEEVYQLGDVGLKDILKTTLAKECGNLSWYAIFDRKFELAEVSARRALALDSNQTWVNTNLAHSLILIGKVEEGKALYDQYKNTKHTDGRLMRLIFLADIDELEKAGISNPAWKEVRKILK